MTTPLEEDNCWDAFGSDDDDDDDDEEESIVPLCEEGVLWLTRHLLRWNPQIPLSQRRVSTELKDWKAALQARGFQIVGRDQLCDAAVVKNDQDSALVRRNVVPCGALVVVVEFGDDDPPLVLDDRVWSKPKHEVCDNHLTTFIKHSCPINETSCPWIPTTHSVLEERRLLSEATVAHSALEIETKGQQLARLTRHDVQRASLCLQKHGYCVIRNLVDPVKCIEWGTAVLEDLDQAASILQERDGVDLRSIAQGHDVVHHNYRELAMREDLRMDLRDGPHLRKLRKEEREQLEEWRSGGGGGGGDSGGDIHGDPSSPIITSSAGSYNSCLRFHPDILEIVKRTMNPKSTDLYRGNFGRYNFEGSGPDGSFQPLRVGPMGGIVSLPGSADQALHADTPHLFEHLDCLPAHYINAFCPGAPDLEVARDEDGSATGSTLVGGTAFIHDSHQLSFTAEMENGDSMSGRTKMIKHLVRPSLQLGDVVLFDCRILHFGLANNSKDVERPLLYVNITHAWFHDPKNWDDRQRIFDSS
jgi:ectoine hydroxylase-related dioxygenase (phytanoyl-CoA dioxygenase family)